MMSNNERDTMLALVGPLTHKRLGKRALVTKLLRDVDLWKRLSLFLYVPWTRESFERECLTAATVLRIRCQSYAWAQIMKHQETTKEDIFVATYDKYARKNHHHHLTKKKF
jgi:hypothetical protein